MKDVLCCLQIGEEDDPAMTEDDRYAAINTEDVSMGEPECIRYISTFSFPSYWSLCIMFLHYSSRYIHIFRFCTYTISRHVYHFLYLTVVVTSSIIWVYW